MARMYSRKGGKSGSSRPTKADVKWVGYKPEEVEAVVEKLAKQGKSPAETGALLRDQYGIPSVKAVNRKKMLQLFREKNLLQELPDDLFSLLKKAVKLRAHLESNKHDRYSKRGLELAESKIRRLARYYKGRHVLPENWQYDPDKAKLLVK